MDALLERPKPIKPITETVTDAPVLAGVRLSDLLPDVPLHLAPYRVGRAQVSGALTVLPLFGPETPGVARPSIGARLFKVHTYGDVELENGDAKLPSIVPLHIGFIQHGAQNHALCRSTLIAAKSRVRFHDACCVQAAQGGFLEGRDQWFFVLPCALRGSALSLQGKSGYHKLWDHIGTFSAGHGLANRGHLEQILTRERAALTQFRSRFERMEDQVGAVFIVDGKLLGVEIAPNAAYWEDVWMPLVCFAHGVAAHYAERDRADAPASEPFSGVATLGELRTALEASRQAADASLRARLSDRPRDRFARKTEQRLGGWILSTLTGATLAGQVVETGKGDLVYASLFAV